MKRPAPVIVFGLLNVLWALVQIGLAIVGLISLKQPENPFVTAMKESAAVAAWFKLSLPLGTIVSLALLISGIGLLLLKRWGRQFATICGFTQIAFSVVALVIHVTITAPALIKQLPMVTRGQEGGMIMGGVVFGTLVELMTIAYSVLLIVFMKRPSVEAAFATEPPPFHR